jgi:polynucleotide 5'-hydroxyl-kinase GRC3/NOL9
MDVPRPWSDLADDLAQHPPGRVYVAGEPDSGKSTFCRFLADRLASSGKPASYLDCDPGQSTIGPPTTIGISLPGRPPLLRFAGSTSPQGYLLQNARAIVALAATAPDDAPLIIDSSGYVRGPAAEEFQYTLLDLLHPSLVVALGEGDAIERAAANFARSGGVRFDRLPTSAKARARRRPERRAYRDRRFGEYFRGATVVRVDVEEVGFNGRVPEPVRRGDALTTDGVRDRLFGLLDPGQMLLALALGERAVDGGRAMELLSGRPDADRPAAVQWSDLRLERSGWERC